MYFVHYIHDVFYKIPSFWLWLAGIDPNLTTKASRNKWETTVAEGIMTPQLKVRLFAIHFLPFHIVFSTLASDNEAFICFDSYMMFIHLLIYNAYVLYADISHCCSKTLLLLQICCTQELDQLLHKSKGFIRTDSRVSSNFIMRATFGDDCSFLTSLAQGSQVHSSAVWSYRERLSLLSLTHIVEQHKQQEELPLLWRFLQKVHVCEM